LPGRCAGSFTYLASTWFFPFPLIVNSTVSNPLKSAL